MSSNGWQPPTPPTGVSPRWWAIHQRTASIFNDVVGRTLVVAAATAGRGSYYADNHRLVLDYGSSAPYTELEHLISHAVHGTDTYALAAWVGPYAASLHKHAGPRTQLTLWAIRSAVAEIASVLDDERVTGLWGQLYPYSAARIRTRHARMAANVVPATPYSTLRAAIHSQLDVSACLFGPAAMRARARIQNTSYRAVELVTRRYLSDCAAEALRAQYLLPPGPSLPSDPWERAAALVRLLAPVTNPTVEPAESGVDVSSTVDVTNDTVLEDELARAQAEAQAELADLTCKLEASAEVNAKRALLARDGLHDVAIEIVRTHGVAPTPDALAVAQLQGEAARIRGRQRAARSHDGTELDIDALIQHRVSPHDQGVFKAPKPSRGFDLYVLVDCSASMAGTKIDAAMQAAATLRAGLKSPTTDLHCIGYHGGEHKKGGDRLVLFPSLYGAQCADGTPTHLVLRWLLNRIRTQGPSRATGILVLTDGEANSYVHTEFACRVAVRNAVRAATVRSIEVTALVVGSEVKGAMTYPSAHTLTTSWGDAWRAIPPSQVQSALSGLVRRTFGRYLSRA